MLTTIALIASFASAHGAESRPSPACDRACLYGVLDQYLSALRAHDSTRVPWAAQAMNTENSVLLRPGDGLWGTLTTLESSYEMRFADVVAGQVAVFGVVDESGTRAPFALRLKVVERAVCHSLTPIFARFPYGTKYWHPRSECRANR
jgi:hypothetical protein